MAAMRTEANRMACCRSLNLRAMAWPPSERERDEDGDHRGDCDRGAQIHPGGERGGRGDRGTERSPERVDVTVIAGREHEARCAHGGGEDVPRGGGLEGPEPRPRRRVA